MAETVRYVSASRKVEARCIRCGRSIRSDEEVIWETDRKTDQGMLIEGLEVVYLCGSCKDRVADGARDSDGG
jgi:DNA-directed RNA polymerase subunit RPC12/RpoP